MIHTGTALAVDEAADILDGLMYVVLGSCVPVDVVDWDGKSTSVSDASDAPVGWFVAGGTVVGGVCGRGESNCFSLSLAAF
jgi:hypothetical protein